MKNYYEIAEFYKTAARSIYEDYIIMQEKCRPGVDAPEAADMVNANPCAYSVSRGAGDVKDERTAEI